MTLSRQRQGFTLIELLIVIAVIGILAAVAMPKLSKARERGLYRSMMSDLRNMQSQQEIYRSHPGNNSTYAATTTYIQNFATSTGVTLEVTEAGTTGWAARRPTADLKAARSARSTRVRSQPFLRRRLPQVW